MADMRPRLAVLRAAVAALAAVAGLGHPTVTAAQTLRGQVMDSVTAEPVVGAQVAVLDGAGAEVMAARTDIDGRFVLDLLGVSEYSLEISVAGYATRSFPPMERVGDDVSFVFLLPISSETEILASIVAAVCPSNMAGPSLAGWVRDENGETLPGAAVVVSWSSLPSVIADRVAASQFSGVSEADSSGFYTICNVPRNIQIALHGVTERGMSNFHSLSFGPGTVAVDGGAYALPGGAVWQLDLTVVDDTRRSTALTGTITELDTGAPVSNAEVEILGTTFSGMTDAAGAFELNGLPGGPARLSIRSLGHEPHQQEIMLPDSGRVDLPRGILTMARSVTELDPVMVETTPARDPLAEFRERRDRGMGSFITREEWVQQGNPVRTTDVLRRMQGVRIEESPDAARGPIISLRRGGPRSFGFGRVPGVSGASGAGCPPLYYMDGRYIGTANQLSVDVIPLSELEAVEAHGSVASIPPEFNRIGAQCGVLAFWSRHAEARAQPVTEPDSGFFSSTGFHFLATIGVIGLIFFALGQTIHF